MSDEITDGQLDEVLARVHNELLAQAELTGRTGMKVDEEYAPGLWRPAVPLPWYGLLHVRCRCGRRFWGWRIQIQRGAASERYQRHYRAEHIAAGRDTTGGAQ